MHWVISGDATPYERYICLILISARLLTGISVPAEAVSEFIIRNLETMFKANRCRTISEVRTISALLPHAISLEQHGQQRMANAIMNAVRASRNRYFMASIKPYTAVLFGKPSSPFRNWVITLVSPHIDWKGTADGENTVVEWAAAVSTVPDAEEVSQSVVDTLLKIAPIESLRPHIPDVVWARMKQREPPPALDFGWRWKTTPATVRYVRGLGDPEITKSYFLHIWSDGYKECGNSLKEMEVAIRGDFGGIGMRCHREELINQLDKVLEGLRQFESSFVPSPTAGGGVTWVEGILPQYMELQEVLLEMEMETLARKPPELSLSTGILISMDAHRINLHVFSTSPLSVTIWGGLAPFHHLVCIHTMIIYKSFPLPLHSSQTVIRCCMDIARVNSGTVFHVADFFS